MDFKMTKKQEQRRVWVGIINETLPQEKWYCKEFECENSIAIDGIYDSEYMNFVYDNIRTYKIKSMLKQFNLKLELKELKN